MIIPFLQQISVVYYGYFVLLYFLSFDWDASDILESVHLLSIELHLLLQSEHNQVTATKIII